MKYYAIGDIHGRHDLLSKALDKIAEHMLENEVDEFDYRIITLGDYIDRGPESKQVIELLMTYGDKFQDKFISIQGNHEAIAVESILTPLDASWWIGNGGDKTLYSYGHPDVVPYEDVMYSFVPQEHVKWMATLPKYYETEKQVFVHAGIPQQNMNLPPASKHAHKEKRAKEAMQWMLYHPADHGGWKGKHVVHGHHQFADGPHVWHDPKKGGRTNLDVQAYKTGRIVVGVFDDTQLHALEFLEVTL